MLLCLAVTTPEIRTRPITATSYNQFRVLPLIDSHLLATQDPFPCCVKVARPIASIVTVSITLPASYYFLTLHRLIKLRLKPVAKTGSIIISDISTNSIKHFSIFFMIFKQITTHCEWVMIEFQSLIRKCLCASWRTSTLVSLFSNH